jgi:pimeloyl-ACP methyl ester carboxylesterase
VTGFLPRKAALLSAAFCLLGTACATPDYFGGSRQQVADWGQERGFSLNSMRSGVFDLLVLERRTGHSDTLTIYIEGDGAAWITAYHPPRDPTPLKPTALALAALDPTDAVAYLGRPCQYLDQTALENCSSLWWTTQRFAPEVLTAYEYALDTLKMHSGTQTIRLVGYSGGGVLAALLALRRQDVSSLITVASPLALGEWARMKGISPLSASLDPVLEPGKLPPATYWIGSDDEVVPIPVIEKFVRSKGGQLRPVQGYDHDCCWTRDWPRLLKESP